MLPILSVCALYGLDKITFRKTKFPLLPDLLKLSEINTFPIFSPGIYPPSPGIYPPSPGIYPPSHGIYPPSHGIYPPSHGIYPPSHVRIWLTKRYQQVLCFPAFVANSTFPDSDTDFLTFLCHCFIFLGL